MAVAREPWLRVQADLDLKLNSNPYKPVTLSKLSPTESNVAIRVMWMITKPVQNFYGD
jgi:hypothetical protein